MAAKFVGIALRKSRQLVDKRFRAKSVGGVTHRSPESDRHASLLEDELYFDVRDRIRHVSTGALDRALIDSVFDEHREDAREDRRGNDALLPRHRPTVLVETGFNPSPE